jgi:hypothetical protein
MQLPWAMTNPFAKADKAALEGPKPAIQQKTNENLDPNDPSKKGPQGKAQGGDDPLADLESLWQPNMDKDGKVIEDEPDDATYMPTLDGKKLQAMVDKMDFMSGITKEEIDAVKAGGEESLGAIANIVNRAGRSSFTRAFHASSKLAEQGFTRAQERFMKSIPNQVKDMMVENGLNDVVGITQNPMFKPLVSQVKNQFMKKFPKASPAEVHSGVKKYFDAMEQEFAKGRKAKDTQIDDPSQKLRKGANDADFEAWLGDEINGMKSNMFATNEEDDSLQT